MREPMLMFMAHLLGRGAAGPTPKQSMLFFNDGGALRPRVESPSRIP